MNETCTRETALTSPFRGPGRPVAGEPGCRSFKWTPVLGAAIALVAMVCACPVGAQTPAPAVQPERIAVPSGDLTWAELHLTGSGEGSLTWSARVSQPWLRLVEAQHQELYNPQERQPVDSLSGSGAVTLKVRTMGHGLSQGFHEGHVLISSNGGDIDVPVTMRVRRIPPVDVSETGVDEGDVPAGAWSTPFAVPVSQALTRPLGEIAAQLRDQSGLDLVDVRLVAITSQRTLYAAAENLHTEWGLTRYEARVWTSADGGATWKALLHARTAGDCYFSTRLQAAALHPDGERVYLGVTNGLYLDDRRVSAPSGLTNVDALHVSADGQYLYVATEELSSACGTSTLPSSRAAVYRGGIIAGSTRHTWEGGSASSLLGFLAPIAAVGSDPANPDVAYLRGGSGAVFRKAQGPAVYGWRHIDAASLPGNVDFTRPALAPATDFVRVPHSYASEYIPYQMESHYGWAGFLMGGDGMAYAHYTGWHGGMFWDKVQASRDGGVSWNHLWTASNYGTTPSWFAYLDASGLVGVMGSGTWTLDPLDPLTSYVASGGGEVSRTRNGGGSWEEVGQGLPGTRGAASVTLDSLGTLYARFGSDVYARPVVEHPLRVAAVTVQPPLVHPGGEALVTARLVPNPLAEGLAPVAPDAVVLRTEMETKRPELRDDGVAPDRVAGDGIWSAALVIPEDRPYGFYGAIVAASTTGASPTRASARATYQVAPAGDLPVFTDTEGADWACSGSGESAVVPSAAHVRAGNAALQVDSTVTCTHAGDALHPFSRTLDLWAFSPTGADSLLVQDARLDSAGLPAGRWVHLSIPAERLEAHPQSYRNWGPEEPEPTLLTQLQFRTDAPVWLDQVVLLDAVPDEIPSAVAEPLDPPLPAASALLPAYPNPGNSSFTIPFHLGRAGPVRLQVHDVLGQRVRTLVQADLPAGRHQVTWNGRDDRGMSLSTGIYFCQLTARGGLAGTGKVVLLR